MNRTSRILIIVGGILLLALPAWANFSPFPQETEEFPFAPLVVFLDFALDLFCILVVLRHLKKVGTHSLGRLLIGEVLAMFAGFTADFLGPRLVQAPAGDTWWLVSVLFTMLLICAANWVLGRTYLTSSTTSWWIQLPPFWVLLRRRSDHHHHAAGIRGDRVRMV